VKKKIKIRKAIKNKILLYFSKLKLMKNYAKLNLNYSKTLFLKQPKILELYVQEKKDLDLKAVVSIE